MTTVPFAWSGEIIHRAASVWESIGEFLCERTCPLRLDSILEICTFKVKIMLKFSSSVTSARSVVKEESKLIDKMLECPLTAAHLTTLPE
jgi:hypothetical protein